MTLGHVTKKRLLEVIDETVEDEDIVYISDYIYSLYGIKFSIDVKHDTTRKKTEVEKLQDKVKDLEEQVTQLDEAIFKKITNFSLTAYRKANGYGRRTF